tara:strand:- start:398 stop:682 length:285 start_codon:yes stop_codon:yes gene_type:complete
MIKKSTSTEVIESALIIPSLIMFQKIANFLSIVSFIMVASMSGGAYFGYKYLTSENFKSRIMNQILSEVSGSMGKVLDKQLPKSTGISIPFNGN